MASKKKRRSREAAPLIEWVSPAQNSTQSGEFGLVIQKNPVRKRDVIWVQVLLHGPNVNSYQYVGYTSAISAFPFDASKWPAGDYLFEARGTDGDSTTVATLPIKIGE